MKVIPDSASTGLYPLMSQVRYATNGEDSEFTLLLFESLIETSIEEENENVEEVLLQMVEEYPLLF